jgi:peptide/nickel transport system permease protein
MGRFILFRLLQMIPLIFGVTLLTFAIINLVPGSPIADLEFNPRARPEDRARIAENLGLNEPMHERYVTWLSNLLRGDLGLSLQNFIPVRDRIFEVMPNTLLLTLSSTVFALVISIPLGIYSAVKRNSILDNFTTIGSMAAYAMPSFWLAFLLLLLFGVKAREWGLPGLPTSGSYDLRGGGGFWDRAEHLILPTVSLGLVQLAGWTRYIRGSMLEVVRLDYIRTAEAKGLRNRAVLFGHAFRNALLPLVTLVGLSLPDLFGGAFIVETIFAWNGMGRLAVDAARQNDYTLVMGLTLMFAVLVLISNLIADVMYAVLDPRIRYG